MSFLVPLYLAGALAVAIPIYLHLRRKPPKEAVEFSSLMFLEPTRHQPIKRQSQLENIPLLLLRCLALLLLAAMFARPFMRGGDVDADEGKARTVILLDTSASMKREGVWSDAVEAAERVIRDVKPDGALAIIATAQAPRTVTSFEDWENAGLARREEIALGALASLEPGWQGTDLGSGLIAAAEMIADAAAADEAARPGRIVVVSDMQAGAALDAVADAAWPAHLEVQLAAIEADEPTNVAISAAAGNDPNKPFVRLRNDAASEHDRFTLRAGGQTIEAAVPPGESRVFQLEEAVAEVTVAGDAHEFDNRLVLAPREAAKVTLHFLGDGKPEDASGPEYFFRNAFGRSKVLDPVFVESLEESPAILAIARALDQAEVSKVRRYLEVGGDALLVVTSTAMDGTLAQLADMGETPELREYEHRYALLEDIDFDHPAMREFRDPRWRDFTDVHFWHYRVIAEEALPEEARMVARFDTGDPAWFEVPAGSGSLFVMMSGWHPHDSQLNRASKFLPLLFSIFSDRGPQVSAPSQFFVGEPLPLEADERELTLPSGKTETIAPETSCRPAEPGLYRASDGERTRTFAVNLRPSESELTPLGAEPLAALGVPVDRAQSERAAADSGSTRQLRDREAEAGQNLWRWAVVILLGMLVLEAWLATRTSAAIPQPEGATS